MTPSPDASPQPAKGRALSALPSPVRTGLTVLALCLAVGAIGSAGPVAQEPPRAGGPAAGGPPFQPVDRQTVSGPAQMSHIAVEGAGAASTWLVELNGRPVLERDVAGGRAGGPRIELGALPLKTGDQLTLSALGPARGGRLIVTPFTAAEAGQDHTARLRATHALVFQDDFNGLQAGPGPDGALWATTQRREARIHNSSPDSLYSDAAFSRQMGAALDPFRVSNGVLSIRPGEIPATALPRVLQSLGAKAPPDRDGPNALRFFSGYLDTHTSWSQTFGYYEMRARLPRGEGLWPAFWLTASVGWPPEIDILEAIYHEDTGAGVNKVHAALHYRRSGPGGRPVPPNRAMGINAPGPTSGPDLYDGFHLYAAEWTPDWVSVFLDGRLIFKAPTPEQMRQPMILVANLQVGTRRPQPGWAADVSDRRVLANSLDIDFIADYRAPAAYPQTSAGPDGVVRAPPLRFPAAGASLAGDGRDNRFETGDGVDIIRTGAGRDVIAVSGRIDAHKIIEDFDPAQDQLALDGFPFASGAEAIAAARQVGPDVWIMAGARPNQPQTIILRGLRLDQLRPQAIAAANPRPRLAAGPSGAGRAGQPGRGRPSGGRPAAQDDEDGDDSGRDDF